MKTVTVYRAVYPWGVRMIGEEITLAKQWKVVITNGGIQLYFKDQNGCWVDEADLYVFETEEFLNECM